MYNPKLFNEGENCKPETLFETPESKEEPKEVENKEEIEKKANAPLKMLAINDDDDNDKKRVRGRRMLKSKKIAPKKSI